MTIRSKSEPVSNTREAGLLLSLLLLAGLVLGLGLISLIGLGGAPISG